MHELSWQCEEIEGERERDNGSSISIRVWERKRLRKIEERRKLRVAYSTWWKKKKSCRSISVEAFEGNEEIKIKREAKDREV